MNENIYTIEIDWARIGLKRRLLSLILGAPLKPEKNTQTYVTSAPTDDQARNDAEHLKIGIIKDRGKLTTTARVVSIKRDGLEICINN